MSKASKKVVRFDELTIPKMIANEDFEDLCKTSHIPSSYRQGVKARLDELVTEFADWIARERQQPDRRSDRNRLKEALAQIDRAAATIERLGPSGGFALKAIAPFAAPMLAAQWISDRFPHDNYVPHKSPLPSEGWRQPLRPPLRGSEYFIEEYSREARFEFVSHRAVKTAAAVLKTIEAGIIGAQQVLDRQHGSKGGRKPLTYRHHLFIKLFIKLAELWDDIGQQVSTGPKSNFAAFCESVTVSIGWPDEGIGAAVPKAVADWRNRTQSKRR
jgi:hypothetical protein